MKTDTLLILLGTWLVVFDGAFGQTTNNVVLDNLGSPTTGPSPIFYLTLGNPVAGPGFYAEVLGGPVDGTLTPLHSSGAGHPTVFPLVDGGFFDGGIGIVPGVAPDGYADFILRAWHGAATFEAAPERVESALLPNVQVGNDGIFPGLPNPSFIPFPSGLVIVPIPEPRAIALGVWACVLLIGLRRYRRPAQ